MGDEVQVTVIATGIEKEIPREMASDMAKSVVKLRDISPEEAEEGWTVRMNGVNLDTPTFQRKGGEPVPPAGREEKAAGRKGFLNKGFFKDNLDYPTFLRAKAD